ncbi:MAG: hypothetical protein L0Z47_07265 [Actinobacteria bacterium]|nr:hypothetical protein [Actinomycetota bacterium]
MRRLALLAVLTVLTGCISATESGQAVYHLSEGVVDGPGRLAEGGTTVVKASNIGEFAHTLVVTDEEGAVLGATGVIPPGEEASLTVELGQGTYVFSCRIVTQDSEGNLLDHYELGMHRTVIVDA